MADTIQTGIQIDVNSDLEGLEQAREGLEQLSEISQGTQEQLEQLGESAGTAQEGLENIAGAEAGEALDNLGSNAENAEERIRQLLEEIMRIAEEAENAGQGLGNLSGEANRAGTGLNNASRNAENSLKIFDNLKAKVAELGATLAALYSAKNIAGFFGSATSQAMDFEEQMRRIQAVMGAYGEKGEAELAKIEAKAKELGASTRFTASEVAEGFEGLARAGLSASQQLSMMNSILATAQGNSISIAQATDIVVTSLSQMGLEANQAGRVADVLSKAAQSANQSVQDLGEGFKFVAPTAKGMGIEIEELSSWLSVLNQNGLKAGMAGTALRNIFTQFSNPASNFRAELQAIGITTNNFEEAIKQLSQSTADTGAVMRSVGAESEGALRILGSGGYEFFGKMQEALKGAAGSAQEAAKTMDSSLSGAVAGLGSAWEGLKLELGKPMLDPLREQVNGLSQSIRDLTQGGGIKAFGEGLANTFKVIAGGIGLIAKYTASIVAIGGTYAVAKTALITWNSALTLHQNHLSTAEKRTEALGKAKTKLGNILKATFTPLNLFTAGISGLIIAYQNLTGGIKEAQKANEEIKNSFLDAKDAITSLQATTQLLAEAEKTRGEASKKVSEEQREQAEKDKAVAEAKIETLEKEIKQGERQVNAMQTRYSWHQKEKNLLNENLNLQREQKEQLEEAVNAYQAVINAEKQAQNQKEALAAQAEKTKEAIKQLEVGVDDSRIALLKIPENSQKVLDSLKIIAEDAQLAGDKMALAFTIGAGKVETQEAMASLEKTFEKARQSANLTAEQVRQVEEAIASNVGRLPAKVDEATVALNALGLTAQQVQTGISKEAGEAIRLFGIAAKNFVDDVDKMALVYGKVKEQMKSEAEFKALDNQLKQVANSNEDFINKVKLANQTQQETIKNSIDLIDRQKQALDSLGISTEAANQGMSKSGLEMRDNLKLGLEAIQANITGAENLQIAFQTAFNQSLNAAQTVADFQALKTVITEAGLSSQLTAEQQGILKAGIEGGTVAVDNYKNSLEQLKSATEQQQMALDALGISIEAANQGMSKAGFEMANNFELAVQAMQKGINNADAFGNSLNTAFEKALSSAQTTADFQALSEALAKTGANAQLSSDAMQVLQAGMQGGAEAAKKMRAELRALAQAQAQVSQTQSDNAKTGEEATKKQTEAQKKLREESQRTTRAMNEIKTPDLGNSGAEKLTNDMQKAKKAIDEGADSVKRMQENFKNLTASAKDSADSIAQQLASLRGEEESVLEMQNTQKLRQLQEKLAEAKTRGNQEEVKQYQRAISLQRELYAEQQKQLEAKKVSSEQGVMSNGVANNQKPLTPKYSSSPSSSISANDVAAAFSEQIEQAKREAMEQGAKLGKEQLAKELIAAAKRRRR